MQIQLIPDSGFNALDDLQKKQIPFATAKTLTNLTKLSVDALKLELSKEFVLRNKFTQNSIRYDKATKVNQQALVYTVSSYLPLQITGGSKQAKSKRFGIPQTGLNVNLNKKIPKSKYVGKIKNTFAIHKGLSVLQFSRGKKRNLLMYVLRKSATINPRFDFEGIINLTVDKNYKIIFNKNLSDAFLTAR